MLKNIAVAVLLIAAGAGAVQLASLGTTAGAQRAPDPVNPVITIEDRAWIGIDYRAEANGTWLLDHVHIGSPAWNSGLMKGDTLIGVEALLNGQPQETSQIPTMQFLAMGLATSPPGTEFKVRVRRSANSMALEKAFVIDFKREKLSVPAVQHFVDHVNRMHVVWQQAEEFWTIIKSGSYRQFSTAQAAQLRGEMARLEVQKLKAEIVKLQDERVLIYANIQNALAQRDLALAQRELAKLQAQKAETEMFGSIFQLVLGLLF